MHNYSCYLEESGEIPGSFAISWEQRKLGDCLSLITYGFTNPMEDTESEPWKLTAKDIGDGYIDYSTARHTSIESYKKLTNKSKPVVGDLLLTKDGTLGRTALVDTNNICINQSVALLRCDEILSANYLNILLKSPRYQNEMLENAGGGTIKHIYITKVDKMFIDIPDIEEQEYISKYFANLGNLITLHQCKQCILYIMKKLLCGKRKQLEKSISWEQRKFGDIGSVAMCKRIFKEQTDEEGEVPFYKIGTFGGEPDAFISRELFDEYKSNYSYPNKGDILISASGSIGRTVEFTGKDEYFQDSNIVWLKHGNKIDNSFLKVLYGVVAWSCEGSTIKRLYNDNFLKTEFMLPRIEEQIKLGEYFSNLDNLIALHQRKP